MADGRELIEQVVAILGQLPRQLDASAEAYAADQRTEMDEILEGATKWVGMCRKKVWLRGLEGTTMAQGCLDAAQRLQDSVGTPTTAIDEAADLSVQLERLARLVATKSQVMT